MYLPHSFMHQVYIDRVVPLICVAAIVQLQLLTLSLSYVHVQCTSSCITCVFILQAMTSQKLEHLQMQLTEEIEVPYRKVIIISPLNNSLAL